MKYKQLENVQVRKHMARSNQELKKSIIPSAVFSNCLSKGLAFLFEK